MQDFVTENCMNRQVYKFIIAEINILTLTQYSLTKTFQSTLQSNIQIERYLE